MTSQVKLNEAHDMIFRMKEGVNWFKGVTVEMPATMERRDKSRAALAQVEDGLNNLGSALNYPSIHLIGEGRGLTGHKTTRVYRWIERHILCQECKKAAGINLTMNTEHDGPTQQAGPFGFRTPASKLSNRHLCDPCLEKMEKQGAGFSKRRPWTLMVSRVWDYQGPPAFVIALMSGAIAIVALIR